MAKIEFLIPKILKWEGGFVNDPIDKGGATNKGVTLNTWKAVGYDIDGDSDIDVDDIRLLDKDHFKLVLAKYWNRWQADAINSQLLANILVDWVWGSGKWGIVIPQRLLGVPADGKVGVQTLSALNSQNEEEFLAKVYAARVDFLHGIVKRDPSQKRFIKGWLNRLEDFKHL